MPSFQIHLAIAKRYIDKHEIVDQHAFIEGSVAPDFVRPKEISHYTRGILSNNLLENLINKVDIERYLKENKVSTEYDQGVFLHLLTDKIFFTEFFDKEFIEKTTQQEFSEDLYTSYGKINNYLAKKYQIEDIPKQLLERIENYIERSKKEQKVTAKTGKDILPLEKIEAFIEKMSSINLKDYIHN